MEITDRMVAGYVTAVTAAIEAAGHTLHGAPSYLVDPHEPIHATIRVIDPADNDPGAIELNWEPEEGGAIGQGWSAAVCSTATGLTSMHTDLRLAGPVVEPEIVAQAVTAILAHGSLRAGRIVPDLAGQLAPYATWPNKSKPPDASVRDGALVCPHCDARASIVEVDSDTRHNPVHVIASSENVRLFVVETEPSREIDRFECRRCKGEVNLPYEIGR